MRHNRRRRIESSGSAKTTQLLALSMFIMLLAFFIVLNALSSFDDDRANPILGSLENTFSSANSDIPNKGPSSRPAIDDIGFKGEGEVAKIDRIKELFRGRIAAVTIKENKERGIMMVSVPYVEFSTAIIALGQTTDSSVGDDASDLPFLPTLVSLMQTDESEITYRMDMLYKIEAEPVDLKIQNPNDFKESRDKIGKLSRRLQAAGVEPKQMSIGLRQGESNMVDLIFSPYEVFDVSDVFKEDAS